MVKKKKKRQRITSESNLNNIGNFQEFEIVRNLKNVIIDLNGVKEMQPTLKFNFSEYAN